MIWPFGHFLASFWILKETVYFKACFAEIWAEFAIFYKIRTLNHVILINFWKKLISFFIFEYLAFLKLLMAKFGLFIFWTWQPWQWCRFPLMFSRICIFLSLIFLSCLQDCQETIRQSRTGNLVKKIIKSEISWWLHSVFWVKLIQFCNVYQSS